MVAPDTNGVKVNFEVPEAPVVEVGLPWHFWMEPAIPPQIERMATFVSCVLRELMRGQYQLRPGMAGEGNGWERSTYTSGSLQVVSVTASGLTVVLARLPIRGAAKVEVARKARVRMLAVSCMLLDVRVRSSLVWL
jgi:hypothetical protein